MRINIRDGKEWEEMGNKGSEGMGMIKDNIAWGWQGIGRDRKNPK